MSIKMLIKHFRNSKDTFQDDSDGNRINSEIAGYDLVNLRRARKEHGLTFKSNWGYQEYVGIPNIGPGKFWKDFKKLLEKLNPSILKKKKDKSEEIRNDKHVA